MFTTPLRLKKNFVQMLLEDRVKKEEEEDEGASDDDKAAEAGDDDEDFLIRDIRYKLEILGFFMFSVAKKFIQRWMK